MEPNKDIPTTLHTATKTSKITHFNHTLSSRQQKFFKKEISFSDAETYFPRDFEMLFLLAYFVCLPYITGVIFVLLFFSNLNLEMMQSIYNSHSFLLSWCIGYEVLAVALLGYIFKKYIFTNL